MLCLLACVLCFEFYPLYLHEKVLFYVSRAVLHGVCDVPFFLLVFSFCFHRIMESFRYLNVSVLLEIWKDKFL